MVVFQIVVGQHIDVGNSRSVEVAGYSCHWRSPVWHEPNPHLRLVAA